jgi:hypothetical protein
MNDKIHQLHTAPIRAYYEGDGYEPSTRVKFRQVLMEVHNADDECYFHNNGKALLDVYTFAHNAIMRTGKDYTKIEIIRDPETGNTEAHFYLRDKT